MKNSALIISLLGLILVSCNDAKTEKLAVSENESKGETVLVAQIENAQIENKTNAAQQWLIKSIEHHFNENKPVNYTIAYQNAKEDALQMGFESEMTDAEWQKKYPNRNTNTIGIGTGFLISGQDYGAIKVENCKLLKQDQKGYWFGLDIVDVDFKIKYKREILVLEKANQFFIDDVKELDK
jgi:hypothetical protein